MNLKEKIRLTIGTKLVGLIGILLVGSVITLVWASTRLFVEDNTALIQQANNDAAASLATQMREVFEDLTDRMRVMGTVLIQPGMNADSKSRVIREFFSKDKDFMAVFLAQKQGESFSTLGRALSPDLLQLGDPDGKKILATLISDKDYQLSQVEKGEIVILSVKLSDGTPATALVLPFIASGDHFSHLLTSVVKQSKFTKAFSESDLVTSFMVDRKGKLLAHPDINRVNSGESLAGLPIVRQLLEGKFNNGQTRYLDPQSSEWKLGAFHSVGFAGLGVVAEVAEAKAFEATRKVEYRSMLIGVIALCLSFMIGYFYSGSITRPIKRLVAAAQQISTGNFKINLHTRGRDELAKLSTAFNEMAKGLEERDRVKDTFNKFHNKEIAEKLLSGEVKLGGERREATVFFSDVRGFTGLSEAMQPEQVVEMLNEYMTSMVSIIRKYGGVVDKYVGDAIMALWGVPIAGQDDAYHAALACLAMREELAKLNEVRISRGQVPLKIGMGLNTGQVIAGNIGSNEKMEYTVIGDTVNLASRIESMTKEYGTDLLISRSIADRVQGRLMLETCQSAKVKGKTNAIEIFQVRGFIDASGKQIVVETPYSSYAAEKSDKVVHEPTHDNILAAASQTTTLTRPEPQLEVRPGRRRNTGSISLLATQEGASSEPVWYFNVGTEVFGPFTAQEILDGLRSREIALNINVSPSVNGPWTLLSEQPELTAVVQQALNAA